eukprot:5393202-Pyramimonas_sp.AAC.1
MCIRDRGCRRAGGRSPEVGRPCPLTACEAVARWFFGAGGPWGAHGRADPKGRQRVLDRCRRRA